MAETALHHRIQSENDKRRRASAQRLLIAKSGDVLLSQGISPQVPSALTGLTSVFGMGTGVTLSPWSPKLIVNGYAPKDSRASTSVRDPSPRPISTGQLNTLLCVHFRPINVVVLPRALLR